MSHLNHKLLRTLTATTAAALIVGCSGGGGMTAGPPAAQTPQIQGPATLEFNQDTTSAPQAFRILDADTPVTSLEIGISSSDSALLPLSGIVVAGSGAERTIRITPAAESVGAATVTVTVRDPGGLSSSAALNVRINPVLVSFRSLTNDSFAASESADRAKVSGVTVQADADDDPHAFDALLQ